MLCSLYSGEKLRPVIYPDTFGMPIATKLEERDLVFDFGERIFSPAIITL
jgi:hypothetical protein